MASTTVWWKPPRKRQLPRSQCAQNLWRRNGAGQFRRRFFSRVDTQQVFAYWTVISYTVFASLPRKHGTIQLRMIATMYTTYSELQDG